MQCDQSRDGDLIAARFAAERKQTEQIDAREIPELVAYLQTLE